MSLNQNLNRECTLHMDKHGLDADECKMGMMQMHECKSQCHPPSHLNINYTGYSGLWTDHNHLRD